MTWYYDKQVIEEPPEGTIGFVYLITNTTNDKKYIGKKLFTFAKTKQVKGKKKKVRVESDWKSYYGSNVELNADVLALGESNFTREILYFCKTKGMCNYLEAKEQFNRSVLERTDYYNSWISVKVHRSHVKT
jgi:hypothetical protein